VTARATQAGFVAPAASASFRVSTGLSLRSGERSWAADRPGELSMRARLKFTTQRHAGPGAVESYLAQSDDPLLQVGALGSYRQKLYKIMYPRSLPA
jgi:hypothetical protein